MIRDELRDELGAHRRRVKHAEKDSLLDVPHFDDGFRGSRRDRWSGGASLDRLLIQGLYPSPDDFAGEFLSLARVGNRDT